MKRLIVVGFVVMFILVTSSVWAQKTVRFSIATGSIGSVYYPLGGGMANVISKYIPYAEAVAVVTNTSVDNCRLVGMKKAELALIMADTAWDAYQGRSQFKEKIPLRTMAVLYPNNMHIVTVEGKGIEKVIDLKGKRVSTGAPGSGTEIMAMRILETYGLNPDKDMKRDRLLPNESSAALKDRKIDAFFWSGGLPTSSVTDIGTTPGIKMKLISHADALPKMREKYGPFYVKGIIPAKTYPGQTVDVQIAVVWNLLVCHENMKENMAYDIVKTIFDYKSELALSYSEARNISFEPQVDGGSPIPFHPGAVRYFTEKELKIK